jgi:hypothetical protein
MHISTRKLALPLAVIAAGAFSPAASAATPAEGTLTLDAPSLEWSGEAMGSVVQFAHFFQGEQIVDECYEQICDSFTVHVKDPGVLTISAEDETGYTEMQIMNEAGEEIFWSGGEDAVPTVYTEVVDKPVTYTVEVLTDALAPAPVDDPSYRGSATLTEPEDEPVEEEE